MSEVAEKLKPILAALSADDRAELMDFLASLERAGEDEELTQEEWEAAWAEELNRRLADFDSGKTQGIPGEEVMRRLREKYG
ncbi:MAG TPA: addiction module protein [Fimbriiglobus sp.]|nr:addiction module protein [Fimbriiglobus sp.]